MRSLAKQCVGATSVEYALICGLIAIVIVVALDALGADLVSTFDRIASAVS